MLKKNVIYLKHFKYQYDPRTGRVLEKSGTPGHVLLTYLVTIPNLGLSQRGKSFYVAPDPVITQATTERWYDRALARLGLNPY